MTALSHRRMFSHEEESSLAATVERQEQQEKEPGPHLLKELEFPEQEMPTTVTQETPADPRELISTLYTHLWPHLYNYLCGVQRLDTDQAQEIIQEAFLRLTSSVLAGERIKNPRGWIVRVSRNLTIDLRRRQSQRWTATDHDEADLLEQIDPGLSQEATLLEAEQMECMEKALEKMNPRHRECLLMRAQGLTLKDIGAAMNMSEPRVTEIVKKVIARLAVLCG